MALNNHSMLERTRRWE